MAREVVSNDPSTWVEAVWELIDAVDFENLEAFRDPAKIENEVKTAMVWIEEALGVD